jgi:hypothetical protein
MRVALAVFAALIAGPALASDEPMATAGQTPIPQAAPTPTPPAATAPVEMTTAQQIDAFLRASPTRDADADGPVDGVVPRDDGKVHGMVEVGVGTGGYRSVYLQSDMPLGDNGRLSLAFEDTRYGRGSYPYGYHGGPAYSGYGGLGEFRGPAPLGMVDRQRCDLEGMSPTRPLDVGGGPHGRCVVAPRR